MAEQRTTGATKAQMKAAVERHPLWEKLSGSWEYDREMEMRVNDWAPLLVPPTHRIVSVDDLRKLLRLHDELAEMTMLAPSTDACAFLDRIRALIEGKP